MECPYCKAENRTGVRYCSNCGKMIGTTVPPTSGGSTSRSLGPGARLQGGRYVIKKILGQGGMGAALLATDIRLDSKQVVIKELLSDNIDPSKLQDDVRNFRREVATLAHIDHPLIPGVTDHFQEGTRYFMVQEYVDGETLEERLNQLNQPLKEREVLICAYEILDVLEYLAQQTPPIVHRDIKPENIIIGARDRRAHLVDFGIARADVTRNTQRKQTSALGTPGYAPPEQYQGNADPRSDLYALGATLHHLLTNRDPRNHPPFTYPPVRTLNAAISEETERILMRVLTNDANQRFQSAASMKQEIDEVLHKRFGISGGAALFSPSGPIRQPDTDATATSMSNLPTAFVAPPPRNTPGMLPSNYPNMHPPTIPTTPATPGALPVMPPFVPSGPVSAPQNYQQSGGYPAYPQFAPPPQQTVTKKPNTTLLMLVVFLILLLLLGGTGVFMVFRGLIPGSTTTPTPSASSGNGIGVTVIDGQKIGISDGTVAFDTERIGGTLKAQAAEKLKQGDTGAAISLLNEAKAKDTNDAETLIYLENLKIAAHPYVTLVVGTMLAGAESTYGTGRENLQGAYVAQKEFNDGAKLANGLKVRLLIASSGGDTKYVKPVIDRIVQLGKSDPTFVGIMGWPFSSRSVAAVSEMSKAKLQIPMVSPTSSSDALTGVSPYFFRVAPPNKGQGVAAAKYAVEKLKAKNVVVFFDQSDTYSQSLAQDFMVEHRGRGNQVLEEFQYTVGKPETVTPSIQKALSLNPEFIYFSGYASDMNALLVNLPPGNIPILGGDALYELNGYSSSGRTNFNRLHFTAFSYPDMWGVLGLQSQTPAFFTAYPNAFDPNRLHKGSPYGYTRPPNDVILSYDATIALLTGCNIALQGKEKITSVDLQQALKTITGPNAIQGVSGQISFGPDGDPIDKTIVMLFVDPNGFIKMEPTISGRFLKQ